MLTLYSWSLKQYKTISSDFLEAANPRVVVVKLKKLKVFRGGSGPKHVG